MAKNNSNCIKTCIGLKSDNINLLNKWHSETGLTKAEIINLLIENAAENKVQLKVTYDLGK